ncbi:unnamed protein product [Closterium sp. NIES-65]|nr:unnamed protein product [Closterium sp. NIES-65]
MGNGLFLDPLTAPADRHLVVTASGPDRLGIVSTLAKRILECGGNVEDSRMRHLVVTASGPDRLGIVSTLAKRILECGGNVEESRMARLAGDFSIIMLIRVDATSPRIAEDLRLKLLEVQGLQVSTRWTVDERSDETAPKRKFRRLVLRGADNPGLVYNVTEYLSSKNINIENLETFTEEAPFGGTMLFLMEGVIAMPIRLPTRQLERQLDALQQSLGVQIELLNLDPKDMVEDWRVWQQTMARSWGLPKYSSLTAAKPPPPFHI